MTAIPQNWPLAIVQVPAREERRLLCTREKPMPKGAHGHWAHASKTDTGQLCDSKCCRVAFCPACGASWKEPIECP